MRKKTYKVNLHLQKKYGCRPEFFDFLNNPRKNLCSIISIWVTKVRLAQFKTLVQGPYLYSIFNCVMWLKLIPHP